jgi:hypothetical protein
MPRGFPEEQHTGQGLSMRLGQAMLVWALARWAADEAPCSQNESHTDSHAILYVQMGVTINQGYRYLGHVENR